MGRPKTILLRIHIGQSGSNLPGGYPARSDSEATIRLRVADRCRRDREQTHTAREWAPWWYAQVGRPVWPEMFEGPPWPKGKSQLGRLLVFLLLSTALPFYMSTWAKLLPRRTSRIGVPRTFDGLMIWYYTSFSYRGSFSTGCWCDVQLTNCYQ